MRAVWSNEPLTKRRPSGSSARQRTSCVVGEGAQDGAVVDVEELDGLVVRAGERVLVVGQHHEGGHPAGVQLREGVLVRVPSRSHTRTWSRSPLRKRWPSGIAATALTCLVCPAQVLTRLLAGDAPHLDEVSYEPLMMCWPSGVTASAYTAMCPLKVWTSVPSTWYSRPSSLPADHSARRRAAPRRRLDSAISKCARGPSSVHSSLPPPSR